MSQLVTHIVDVTLSVSLVGCSAQEECFRHRNGNHVLEHPHVKAIALETMLHHKQVQAGVRGAVLRLEDAWVHPACWVNLEG